MIKHIVSFKLQEEYKDKAELIKQELEALPKKIKQIKTFEVGLNISEAESAYDVVLLSSFESIDDLNIYRNHIEHQKVLTIINAYKSESMVVDYKI